jgi:hypothetical protein
MAENRMNEHCWHDYGGVSIMPMAYSGHALYVRKCRPGDAVDGKEHLRALDGIVLPDAAGDRSQWVEVLAVGPNVGKRCTKEHARRLRGAWIEQSGLQDARRSNIPQDIVGHLAYIAVNDDPRIKGSFMSVDEAFIEESLPVALLPQQH